MKYNQTIGSVFEQVCSSSISLFVRLLQNRYRLSTHRAVRFISAGKSRFCKHTMHDSLPFFASGEIVHGFGRGSKELGIPTANYALEVVKSLPAAIKTGIYYGWANVDNGTVYKMVMSVGWNPYYENKEKSMETHIMHNFNCDLYGCLLKVCIVGYLRPEMNFSSLDELIAAIRNDIAQAENLLDSDAKSQILKESNFFKCNGSAEAKPQTTNGIRENGS